jgi:NADH:ubiquinone oxidoreductase subunit 6 (subunit J)
LIASFGFYVSAVIALIAALVVVRARRHERALGGLAVTFAALLVPLIQLGAATVAAAVLLSTTMIVVLLAMLPRMRAGGEVQPERAPRIYWLPAALGLLGFAWVVLATGSRQVAEHGETLKPTQRFGDGGLLFIQLGNDFVVPALLVALLALCAVIAAVLGGRTLGPSEARVSERAGEAEHSESGPS